MTEQELSELKEKIRVSKYTRKQIAEKIDVAYGTLSGYLNGFFEMPKYVLESLEEVLK